MPRRKPKPMDGIDYGAHPIGVPRPDGVVPMLSETMQAGVRTVRAHDILDQWLTAQIIDKAHVNAARAFEADYVNAHLLPNYATMPLDRVDGGQGSDYGGIRYAQARKRAIEAMWAMGKRGSEAIEAVVCNGHSIATYSGMSGQSREVIKGLMLGALSVLSRIYRTGG